MAEPAHETTNASSKRGISGFYARELGALRSRVLRALEAFKSGGLILVGDDGRRENEADLVFHAGAATRENVNFAITHGRGLLCVSVSHEIADRLAFASAPKLPGGMAHTGFTLAVDARENISSGISAADRAHTIRLMADPRSGPTDFITPGHVFPVRANDGGLLARSGHTEAVLEICKLAELPAAAAMCEILAEDGDALRPQVLLKPGASAGNAKDGHPFYQLPFLSTIDLLWYRVFYGNNHPSQWKKLTEHEALEGGGGPNQSLRLPISAWLLERGLEEKISFPAALFVFSQDFSAEKLRIVVSNGISSWDNGVPRDTACAEISIFSFAGAGAPLHGAVNDFCDLSQKEGLAGTRPAVRRVVSLLRAFEFLKLQHSATRSLTELVAQSAFPFAEDKEFLRAVLTL